MASRLVWLIGISLLSVSASVSAAETYTLTTILNHAVDSSDDVRIAQLSYQAGRAQVTFYRSEALPYVGFSTNASWASQSSAAQNAGGSAVLGSPDRLEGTSLSWNVNLKQPLVTFGRAMNALKLAKVRDTMLVDSRSYQRDMFVLNVVGAFSEAFLAQESVVISEKSLAQAEQLLKRVEGDVDMGLASQRDLLRMRARAKGEEVGLASARTAHRAALKRLANLVELEFGQDVVLSIGDRKGVFDLPGPADSSLSLQWKLAKHEASLRELHIAYQRALLLPTISLVGGLSNQFMVYGGDTEDELQESNEQLEQMFSSMLPPQQAAQLQDGEAEYPNAGDYFNADYVSYRIGVQLDWTIFNGRRSYASYRQAQHEAAIADLRQKKAREENHAQIIEARDQVATIEESIAARQLQLEAARKSFEKTDADYDEGAADLATLLDVEREFREAERALKQLQIHYVLAVAQLRAALGERLYAESY